MTRWLSEEEQALWRAWLAIGAALDDAIEEDLHERGLTGADYEILAHLSEAAGGTMRMTELANVVRFSKSRLTYRVAHLEARGLVQRSTCAEDGRGVLASITKAGMRAIEQAAPSHVETVRAALIDHLRPATRRALAADLANALAAQGRLPHGTHEAAASQGPRDGAGRRTKRARSVGSPA